MQPPDDDAWEAWSPDELFARLGATADEWYVVGGWALDLWHGAPTRAHADLEFSVPASQAHHYRRALSELEFFSVNSGKFGHLSPDAPLPSGIWQQWGADRSAGCWRVDMMVDRGSTDQWVYKRDPRLSIPREDAIRSAASGIRYLAPHLVLLFKAKHTRAKDNTDFNLALPGLGSRPIDFGICA